MDFSANPNQLIRGKMKNLNTGILCNIRDKTETKSAYVKSSERRLDRLSRENMERSLSKNDHKSFPKRKTS